MVRRTTLHHLSAEEKKERKRAYIREYHRRNKDRVRAHGRKYRAKHYPIIRIQNWFRRRWKYVAKYEEAHLSDRRSRLRKAFGMTPADYARLLEAQGGDCAICRKPEWRKNRSRYLCVDHCHKTGKVRGLLCHGCNTALGCVRDDPAVLAAMIEYLGKHGG